jgi:hypothetical protein
MNRFALAVFDVPADTGARQDRQESNILRGFTIADLSPWPSRLEASPSFDARHEQTDQSHAQWGFIELENYFVEFHCIIEFVLQNSTAFAVCGTLR